jgi:hypothetical protein
MRLIPCWEIGPDGHTCACEKGVLCGKDSGKHPHLLDWVTTASADPTQVQTWHQQWPTANWAWVLDRHLVIDVDPRNGGPEPDQLDTAWENIFGWSMPTTLTQRTGGGGLHLVYGQNGQVVRNTKIWQPDGKRKLDGFDVKGVGGYIMVCPSNHKSGGSYEWKNAGQPIAAAPDELLAATHKPSPPSSSSSSVTGQSEVNQDGEALDFDHWLAEGPNVERGGQREHLLRGIGWMRNRFYTRLTAITLAWQVASTFVNHDPNDPWTSEYVIKLVDDAWGRWPAGEQPEPWMTQLAQGVRASAGTQTATTAVTEALLSRLAPAGNFALDEPAVIPAVWGDGERVLWAEGEGMMIAGPQGTGKTTLAQQLVLRRIGLRDSPLLGLAVAPSTRTCSTSRWTGRARRPAAFGA